MPAILQRPTATQDLTITHLGLFQSVQTATNSVSLIAGKPALLRVFAQSVGADAPAVAEVTVHAQRGATDLGSLTLGPEAVSAQPTAGDLSSTFNFDLPQEWLSGEVTLTATIDAVNTVLEANEANNTHAAQFSFLTVAPLRLTIIPISYHDTLTGQTFLDAPHDPISDWLRGAFPVSQIDVTYHPPFFFSGDLRQPSEWQRLLDGLTTLWAAEVGFGSPTVYYGLIPSVNASGATWFEGGVSGLGWIGQRVSLGLDVGAATGNSAGHELGHNFGRRHAPCGNPSGVDPHYPYPNATIGVYGVDTEEEVVLAPAANFDMMSYCGPEWVSDYTYEALLSDQLARAGQAGAQSDGLLLRATLASDADASAATAGPPTVTVLPVYRLSGAALPADDSGYTAQLLDESGAVVATHPATLLAAEETGVAARLLVAHVPAPQAAVAAVRFLHEGRVVGERVLAGVDATAAGAAQATATAGGLALSWGRADAPALVRVSADGAQWTTLAVDAGGEFTVAHEQLPAGGQIQIVPGDGGPAQTIELD